MESEDRHAGEDDGDGGKGIAGFNGLTYEAREGQEKGIDDYAGPVEDDTEIWLDDGSDILVDDGIFYGDDDAFHPLPDFPSLSSSSSSSSSAAPPPSNSISAVATSSFSSSSASWGVLDDTNNKRTAALIGIPSPPPLRDVDCGDVMENFGYMDLIQNNNDSWDPSSLDQFLQDPPPSATSAVEPAATLVSQAATEAGEGGEATGASEDLAVLFFEWLKSNRESISAEDLRRIKLRRATIECAALRLGGGREGTKRLLMLILDWVQHCHLQKKPCDVHLHRHRSFENPNPRFEVPTSPACTTCGLPAQWSAPTPPADLATAHLFRSPSDYQMLEPAASWSAPQFVTHTNYASFPDGAVAAATLPNPQVVYGGCGQYQCYSGGRQSEGTPVRVGASATKEARKKRMARQRRSYSKHQHRSDSSGGGGQSSRQKMPVHHHAQLGGSGGGCTPLVQHNSGKWVYWPAPPPAVQPLPPDPPPAVNPQSYQRQMDRRQGWKHEKNLRFLLQKVLKQSDVGSLGRIVLPKKDAEMYLPELVARDGITIDMEDIGTNRVWNMRYRFWPNNKSRMYLLENTGDFVRSNELQEGDFIVIYSDLKCGKYMIRGVKVRQQQQQTPKVERKKPAGKAQRSRPHSPSSTSTSLAGNAMSSCVTTPTTPNPSSKY